MKKGFVFTLISILFVSVILIAFLIQTTNITRVKTEEARVKVETVNAFLKSIKNNQIDNSIKTSTTRAFGAMIECINAQTGQGQTKLYRNPSEVLNLIIKFGNIDQLTGQDSDKKNVCNLVITEYMVVRGKSLTLSNTLQELIDAADQIGLDLDFDPINTPGVNDVPSDPNLYNLDIGQTDPWNVDVTITLDFDLKTEDNTIKWEIRNFQNKAKVSIIGLRDPVYSAFEGESFVIYKWNALPGGTLDFEDMISRVRFYDPIAQGKTINERKPSSFLERFDWEDYNNGNLQCNGINGYCGIETLRAPSDDTLTWVDYLQYNPPTQGQLCLNTPGSDYNVRLDVNHDDPVYPCLTT